MRKQILFLFALLCLLAVQGFSQNPSAISVSPNSGTGAAQTFSVMVTPNTGNPQDINVVVLDITDGGGRHCNGIFDWHNHAIALYNDANSGLVNNQWMTTGTGTSTGQTNSQCTLTTGGANYAFSGSNLVVYFPMAFNSSFAGTKTELVYVSNLSGNGNGVQSMGSWIVPGSGGSPSVVSVSPNAGTGLVQTFAVTVSAADGNPQNLPTVVLDIGDGAGHHCNGNYQQNTSSIALYNDANTNIVNGQWMIAGSNATQTNSQCTLTAAGAHHTFSGSTITVYFPMTFNVSFAGTKTELVYAADGGGHGIVQNMGSWTVPNMNNLVPGSSGTSEVTDVVQTAPDAFSGATVNIPTIARPAAYAELWVPSGTRVAKVGDPMTITLSNVKPNSQVWVTEIAVTDPGVAQGAYTSSGYVGMSDNSGQFIWQTVVSSWLEAHTYTLWVGYWGGPATGPRPDSDIVASVSLWATDASGNPAAPGALAQLTNQ